MLYLSIDQVVKRGKSISQGEYKYCNKKFYYVSLQNCEAFSATDSDDEDQTEWWWHWMHLIFVSNKQFFCLNRRGFLLRQQYTQLAVLSKTWNWVNSKLDASL